MRKGFRQRMGAGIAATGLVAIFVGLGAGVSHAEESGCNGVFTGGNPEWTVEITSTPAGGNVQAGQEISIDATWDTSDWVSLDKVDSCVAFGSVPEAGHKFNGTVDASLSDTEKPTENDGEFSRQITIPAQTPAGTRICVAVGVHGDPSDSGDTTQKSNQICFDVVAASDGGQDGGQDGGEDGGEDGGQGGGQGGGQDGGQDTGTNGEVLGETVTAGTTTPGSGTTSGTTAVNTTPSSPGSDVLGVLYTDPAQSGTNVTNAGGGTSGVSGTQLPRTGTASHQLVLVAGAALLLGGLSVAFGEGRKFAPRTPH